MVLLLNQCLRDFVSTVSACTEAPNVGAKPRPTDARRTRASASALTMSEKARSGRRLQRLVSRHCAEPRPQFAWL